MSDLMTRVTRDPGQGTTGRNAKRREAASENLADGFGGPRVWAAV